MKLNQLLIVVCVSLLIVSCDKVEETNIVTTDVNENIAVPYAKLQTDEILSTMVNGQVMVFDSYGLDLDGDELVDLTFEVVDLTLWNGVMPDHPDNLAARVHTSSTTELLDNSTFGYPDALNNEGIFDVGEWSERGSFVLGTIADAGLFEGKTGHHLAFRISNNGGYNYGWVKLDCSAVSDVLTIHSYGLNLTPDTAILAGQTE